jgi:hypothetical protein
VVGRVTWGFAIVTGRAVPANFFVSRIAHLVDCRQDFEELILSNDA